MSFCWGCEKTHRTKKFCTKGNALMEVATEKFKKQKFLLITVGLVILMVILLFCMLFIVPLVFHRHSCLAVTVNI